MGWGTKLVGFDAARDAINAIKFEFDDGAVYLAGPTAKYAVYHETGTSKMKARPFARPAAEKVQSDIGKYASKYAPNPDSPEELLEAVAIAVQAEMVKIITRKGLVDTGNMRASVSIEKVK